MHRKTTQCILRIGQFLGNLRALSGAYRKPVGVLKGIWGCAKIRIRWLPLAECRCAAFATEWSPLIAARGYRAGISRGLCLKLVTEYQWNHWRKRPTNIAVASKRPITRAVMPKVLNTYFQLSQSSRTSSSLNRPSADNLSN